MSAHGNPADDYVEKTLDLNELLIKRPAVTFFVRVEGDSLLGVGIHPDDTLKRWNSLIRYADTIHFSQHKKQKFFMQKSSTAFFNLFLKGGWGVSSYMPGLLTQYSAFFTMQTSQQSAPAE